MHDMAAYSHDKLQQCSSECCRVKVELTFYWRDCATLKHATFRPFPAAPPLWEKKAAPLTLPLLLLDACWVSGGASLGST